MKMTPLISVIVPVYNIESYLPQCIESILQQTYSNLEIILVDDGAMDSSGAICDAYAKKDCRIRVIHKENEGLVAARKTGFEHSKGEYVFHLDGDDWIDCEALEMLERAARNNNSKLVQMGFVIEEDNPRLQQYQNAVIEVDDCARERLLTNWMDGKAVLDNQIFNKLFSRELFEMIYSAVPKEMSYGEDCLCFLHLLKCIEQFCTITNCLYHYRVRNTSLSHQQNDMDRLLREDNFLYQMSKMIKQLSLVRGEKKLEKWILKRKMMALKLYASNCQIQVGLYAYREIEHLIDKKVVIYGAGDVGKDFILQLSKYENINIVGWVDLQAAKYRYEFRKVEEVESIIHKQYDVILIALYDEEIRKKIYTSLKNNYNVDPTKILWDYTL